MKTIVLTISKQWPPPIVYAKQNDLQLGADFSVVVHLFDLSHQKQRRKK
jgi:hypothetical protein